MKKVLSIVLAIAMIATMSAVAFAETVTFGGETGVAEIPEGGFVKEGIVVAGTYNGTGLVDMYKVDVEWPAFTYTFSSGKTWNPVDYTWDLTGNGTWVDKDVAKEITITNHSSAAIKVAAEYEGLEGTDFTFEIDDEGVIAGASKGEYEVGEAVEGVIAATFVPGEYTIADDVDSIGTITVTIIAA
ncbi:MAG: hypothetical protein IJ995_05645 [Clostridia bacterium]|nr:hypothetical protein [Clostridia bacterium]